MLMPGRQFGQGENFPGVLVNGTTTVNGYSLPIDLSLTSRATGDATEYVASSSVEFRGEFESGPTDEFTAYIADNTYAGTGNQVTGGGAYGTAGRYRYGYNGKENDNEVNGSGNQVDYGERIYDPRIGRFLSVDPLTKGYPMLTPYQFASNSPIAAIDIDGEEAGIPMNGVGWSGTPMSNYFDNAAGRKLWVKTMGTGIAVGGAATVDVFVTKGWMTRTLLLSQAFGLVEHNRATSPKGKAAQDARFKENATDLAFNLGGGIILGNAAKGFRALAAETRTLYNFGSNALGEMGEEALSRQFQTIKPTGKGSSLSTSLGARKPDGIPVGTTVANTDKLFESKVGLKNYSGEIVNQVAKDAELLATGKVDEITWVFFRSPSTGKMGATDDLLKELEKAGIKTKIGGDIPRDILNKAVIKYGATPKR